MSAFLGLVLSFSVANPAPVCQPRPMFAPPPPQVVCVVQQQTPPPQFLPAYVPVSGTYVPRECVPLYLQAQRAQQTRQPVFVQVPVVYYQPAPVQVRRTEVIQFNVGFGTGGHRR